MSRFQVVLIASGLAIGLFGTAAQAGGRVAVLNVEGDQSGQVEDALTSIVQDEHEVVSAHTFEQAADKAGVATLDTKGIAKVAKRLSVAAVLESVMTKQDDGYQLLVRVRTAAGKTTKKLTVVMAQKKLTTKDKQSLGDRVLAALDEIDPRSGRAKRDVTMSEDEREASARRLKKLGGIDSDDAEADAGDDDAADDEAAQEDPPVKVKKAKKLTRAEKAAAKRAEKAAAKAAARAEKKARKAKAAEKAREAEMAKAAAAEEERAEPETEVAEAEPAADAEPPKRAKKAKARAKDDDTASDEDRAQVATRDEAAEIQMGGADDAEDPISHRGGRGDDETEDGIGARASRRARGSQLQAAVVEAGASVTGRTLTFNSRPDFAQAPKGYQGPYVPGAHVAGVVYPAALADRSGWAAGLGVDFEYDKTVALTTRTSQAMDIGLPTTEAHWMVGARYRIAFGKHADSASVAVGVGYGRRVFSVDRSALPIGANLDLPDVDYRVIAPGVAVRLPIGSRIAITADGRALLFQSAGAIQTAEEYGGAKITGGEGSAGVEVSITSNVMLHVSGSATLIGYAFLGNGANSTNRDGDGTTKDVGGALDQYLGGSATLGFSY